MNVRFSKKEVIDIILAIAVLSIAFDLVFYTKNFTIISFIAGFGISLIAVVTAFLGHEMAHKFASFRYGYYSEFKRWNFGILLALFTSLFGLIFAAPGAVNIYGFVDQDKYGKISAAGPVFNIVLGFAFFVAMIFTKLSVLSFFAFLNFWLAFFNLLPIPPLDGSKVFRWSMTIYITLILISGFFVALFFGLI